MSDKKDVAMKLWKQLGTDKWDHPDPRLAGIILMMSGNGFKPSKIAEIVGMNLQMLKRHYKRELANGAAAIDMEIFNSVVTKALNPENPKLALKAAEIYMKYKPKRADEEDPEEVAPKSQSDAVNGMIDPKKLTIEELRTLTELLDKAKVESPNIIIDVKATRRE